MGGGVSGGTSSAVYGLDINPYDSYDSTYGFRHKVYVSGVFDKAAGSTVNATNVATWTEYYAQPWFGVGGGITYQYHDLDDFCTLKTDYVQSPVWSQAISGGPSVIDVHYAGTFNKIDNTAYVQSQDSCTQNASACNWYSFLNMGRWVGGGALSTVPSGTSAKAMYYYDGIAGFIPFRSTAVAANSSGVYYSCGDGTMIVPAGSNCGAGTVAAGWYFNGTTWSAIGGTSPAGYPAPVPFLNVVSGGTVAFFVTGHPYPNGPIWKFVP